MSSYIGGLLDGRPHHPTSVVRRRTVTETADLLPVDPQSLAKVMAETRAQHPGDVNAQVRALDALYRRLQEQEGPLMGQASLDAWLAAGRIATAAEAAS